MSVLELMIAAGLHPYEAAHSVIEKVWQRSHPESFRVAKQKWGPGQQAHSKLNTWDHAQTPAGWQIS